MFFYLPLPTRKYLPSQKKKMLGQEEASQNTSKNFLSKLFDTSISSRPEKSTSVDFDSTSTMALKKNEFEREYVEIYMNKTNLLQNLVTELDQLKMLKETVLE
jgi:hypothetical protein